MKIYRISAAQQMIPQNPGAPADLNINSQNMQNALSSIGEIDKIIDAANQVNEALTNLDDAVGSDTGMKQEISNKLNEILTSNPSINLLMQMNLLPSIASLFNAGDWDRIKIKITNDAQKIEQQKAEQAQNQNQGEQQQ